MHLESVAKLPYIPLAALLKEHHPELVLSAKEYGMLQELIQILQPFAEATQLVQGEKYPTAGCVVPSVIAMDNCLTKLLQTAIHHIPVIRALQKALRERFLGLFQELLIIPLPVNTRDGAEADVANPTKNAIQGQNLVYLVASFLDPSYSCA